MSEPRGDGPKKGPFDLADPHLQIRECEKCDEPVCGTIDGSRVALTCGYCGFEDLREIAKPYEGVVVERLERPYRGREGSSKRSSAVRLDFSPILPGLTAKSTPADARRLWKEEKHAPSPADAEDHEYRLMWLTLALANSWAATGDNLRARAILETMFDRAKTPAYRGILAARLARHAARVDGFELAEKWLERSPEKLRVVEVSSELTVSRAFLAHRRGDVKGVLREIGERDTVDEIVGPTRWLAMALRVDAHERNGERNVALSLWMTSSRVPGGNLALSQTAKLYGLAQSTARRVIHRSFIALGILGALAISVLALLRALIVGDRLPGWAFAGLGVAVVAALVFRASRARA